MENMIEVYEKQATELIIRDQASYDAAMNFIMMCKAMIRTVKEKFIPMREAAAEAKRAAEANRKAIEKEETEACRPYQEIVDKVESKAESWRTEEQRRRDEETRIANEAIRKAAEDIRLAEVQKLEDKGDKVGAEAALAAPIIPPVVVQTEKVSAPPGMYWRKIYKYHIIDVPLVPRELCEPSDRLIGLYARREKEEASAPGIRFFTEEILVTRQQKDRMDEEDW